MSEPRRLVFLFGAAGVLLAAVACSSADRESGVAWTLTAEARQQVTDRELEARIFAALDAAATAGTDPSISGYHVRAATVVEHQGVDHVVVGGNTEWAGYPEAIHGETSLMNHVINLVGPEAARERVDFLAFYTDRACGTGGSCGDCRDYLMTTTRWRDLLIVCGSAADHTVHVRRFEPWVVPESAFPEVAADEIDLAPERLQELVESALAARAAGVALFTSEEEHLGVAALSTEGNLYRAAGADDAAFHYRYPVGAVLQQAASHGDYFVAVILVATAPGHLPRISYRDRQYGFEASSFNSKRGHPPIRLLLVEEAEDGSSRRFRRTTFEEALPGAFSTASFMPEAVDRFLEKRAPRR